MENLIVRRSDAFDRVVDFGADHPLDPAMPAVTTLLTQLGDIVTAIGGHAGDQDIGRGEFRGGSAYRQMVADQLRTQMRPINKIARALKPAQFPGVREQFHMPPSGGYSKLIARAEAFGTAIAPIKQAFVDRGMAADFDTALAAKKAELMAATGLKNSGHATQMSGTAGLLAKSREGMEILHELDAILSHQYRNNPALLAAWKGACRVERGAEPEQPVGTAGGGATTPTPSAPTPTP
jgi:hypothetical protein